MTRRSFLPRPTDRLQLKKPALSTDATTFGETMQRIGARPLRPGPGRVGPAPRTERVKVQSPFVPPFHVEQRAELVYGHRMKLPARDRRRINGPPGASLDLHGHEVESARRTLATFLAQERGRGRIRVLVIVGKGRHTAGGVGVLREKIAEWLSRAPLGAHVLGFVTAPPHLGGAGSVIVLLAPSSAR